MKTQLSIVLACLFISVFSFAQTKTALKTEKIKVWGNCEMCKAKIEKAAKAAGASYALWNDEAHVLTVKYTEGKTSTDKIEKKVAAAGYDTQNETATQEAYDKLPGCCQYDRKATTTIESTSMSCCKDTATCKKDCCTKEDMSCCKGKDAKHDCCKDGKSCCTK